MSTWKWVGVVLLIATVSFFIGSYTGSKEVIAWEGRTRLTLEAAGEWMRGYESMEKREEEWIKANNEKREPNLPPKYVPHPKSFE